jgi:hypothetical protein
MDVHVPRAITDALKLRDIDVLTADEDGSRRLTDPELLDRATALARVLFTRDADLLAEATRRQRTGQSFSGIVFGHQLLVSIGQCVHEPRAARRGGAARGACRPGPAPSVALNGPPGGVDPLSFATRSATAVSGVRIVIPATGA